MAKDSKTTPDSAESTANASTLCLDPIDIVDGNAHVVFAKLTSEQRLAIVRRRIDTIKPNFANCPGFVPLTKWGHWINIGQSSRLAEIHMPVKRLRSDFRDPSKTFLGVCELFTEFGKEFHKSGRIDELVITPLGNFGILSAVYALNVRPGEYFYQATECTFRIVRDERIMGYLDASGYRLAHGIIMTIYKAINDCWHNLHNELTGYETRMHQYMDAWHRVS